MKAAKILLLVGLAVAGLFFFIRFFLGQLGAARHQELAGIVLTAPPGFAVADLGAADRAAAARELASRAARRPDETKLGVRFRSGGSDLLWLLDRSDAAGALLLERSAGAGGTRLETTWRGAIAERLAWAGEHGGFDAPGLAPGERRNLYH